MELEVIEKKQEFDMKHLDSIGFVTCSLQRLNHQYAYSEIS